MISVYLLLDWFYTACFVGLGVCAMQNNASDDALTRHFSHGVTLNGNTCYGYLAYLCIKQK